MQALNITIFRIIAVSLDVRIVNIYFLFYMQFEFVCIPISTLTFGHCLGKKVTAPPPFKSEGARTPMLKYMLT